MDLKTIKNQFQKEVKDVETLKDLEGLWEKYLGKKGEITLFFKDLKKLSSEKRKDLGKEANEIKKEIEEEIKEKRSLLLKATEVSKTKGFFDVSLPGKKIPRGHLHPLTQVLFECEEIFGKMGFEVVEGPEIENEWYNFDALNIPKDHPARDLWSTLWLKSTNNQQLKTKNESYKSSVESYKFLLRTHTSPNQVHYMEKHNPPIRIVVPGRVFRYEATDASHEIQFYQLEGLMVDKYISLANLKATLIEFFKSFFGKDIEVRFRPGYFPFTEPSVEADIKFEGKWLETLGGGMVHPNVFKNAGLNPKDCQGFAFGMGIDRLTMLKHKINDIRLFYSGDLRFLEQE